MRVISQDGTIDMPYEQVVIQKFKNDIYFLNKNLTGVEQLVSDMVVATYSTEEKAKKAMEMLRIAYENNVFYHCTAGSKCFEEVRSILSEEQFQKATTEYFQFPAEEELE
jgi:hypothetical protein|nr:MAG TPA: hypothetical protein [Caudoviricetes sp.]